MTDPAVVISSEARNLAFGLYRLQKQKRDPSTTLGMTRTGIREGGGVVQDDKPCRCHPEPEAKDLSLRSQAGLVAGTGKGFHRLPEQPLVPACSRQA